MVEIKGIEKFASKDFPGYISSTVFLAGCNFRCPFCHNSDLVINPDARPTLDLNFFLSYLDSRKGWLDGICLSGGEPLLSDEVEVLARVIKDRGFLLKIDTNGSFPERLESLLKEGLIDSVAMDIKGPLERYPEIVRVKADLAKINRSVEIIRNSGVEYLFRTTVVPGLIGENDLIQIARWLEGAKVFQLQQFVPQNTLDPEYLKIVPYSSEVLHSWAERLKPYFEEVRLEGV